MNVFLISPVIVWSGRAVRIARVGGGGCSQRAWMRGVTGGGRWRGSGGGGYEVAA